MCFGRNWFTKSTPDERRWSGAVTNLDSDIGVANLDSDIGVANLDSDIGVASRDGCYKHKFR
jgi:hypothetical protein